MSDTQGSSQLHDNRAVIDPRTITIEPAVHNTRCSQGCCLSIRHTSRNGRTGCQDSNEKFESVYFDNESSVRQRSWPPQRYGRPHLRGGCLRWAWLKFLQWYRPRIAMEAPSSMGWSSIQGADRDLELGGSTGWCCVWRMVEEECPGIQLGRHHRDYQTRKSEARIST